ncbi:DNA methyltransferase [Spiroplasma endosymbiont of Aspidapion aeneum]|uniref:DNA methyltransferase n=1 Tax=Spiroplasma endosymbiont of Aspidapion aeneum TaxID=3066276 RepID=UPI00313E8258
MIVIRLYKGDNLDIIPTIKEKPNIVYLDPPYNTKNSKLIYHDVFNNPNEWKEGFEKRVIEIKKIIQYKSVIYVSIGIEELGNAKVVMDNVFGINSCVAVMPRRTCSTAKTTNRISKINDFVLVYVTGNIAFQKKAIDKSVYKLKDEHFEKRGFYHLRRLDYKDFLYSASSDFGIDYKGVTYYPSGDIQSWRDRKERHFLKDWCWLWSANKINFAIENDFIVFKNNRVYKKTYTNCKIDSECKSNYKIVYEDRSQPISSIDLLDKRFVGENSTKTETDSLFAYRKSNKLIKFLFELPILEHKVVLDPYAGSGVSAIISNELGIDCILIQKSEKIKENKGRSENFNYEDIFDITKAILKERQIEVDIINE